MLSRKEYKAQVALQKKSYKEELKALKKERWREKKVNPIGSRVEYTMDSVTLKVCEPFERKAADIRFKRSNPEAYAARMFLRDITPLVGYLAKKADKKPLKDREQGLLVQLDTKLGELELSGYVQGPEMEQLVAIRAEILKALPLEVTQQLTQLEQFVAGMAEFFKQGSPEMPSEGFLQLIPQKL